MPKLTTQQLTELGDDFLAFAQAIGDYRIANRATLNKKNNEQLKNFHWTLLNYADDFYTTSSKLIIDNNVQASLDAINDVTGEINKTLKNLSKIQKAIDIAEAGVTLGAAIFSKNPQSITDAITNLLKSWKKKDS